MNISKNFFKRIIIKNKIQSFMFGADSFSQYGEDNIILEMLGLYNIRDIKYMDIGAHHPFILSNTALLYKKGFRGTNIEPDPSLFKKFIKYRANDINLNIGIHKYKNVVTFYQFERPEFNTFSKDAAIEIEKVGIKKINEKNIQVDTYNNVVKDSLFGNPPDILFIDAEGLDELILESIDFEKYAPKIICVETYAYGIGLKNYKIINFLLQKDFKIHADTFVNTIFIKKNLSSNVLF